MRSYREFMARVSERFNRLTPIEGERGGFCVRDSRGRFVKREEWIAAK